MQKLYLNIFYVTGSSMSWRRLLRRTLQLEKKNQHEENYLIIAA